MKRKILYTFLTVAMVSAGGLFALDKAEELKKLEVERAKLTWKMVDKRAEIIASDEACRALHDQIMSLHRELAIKLDANQDMRKLNQQAEELDNKIAELKK